MLLNATSMFNHGNVRLPPVLDRALRWIVVTPDRHCIHHSAEDDEINSNVGFNLPWWDRLLGTRGELLLRQAGSTAKAAEAASVSVEQLRSLSDSKPSPSNCAR